MKIPWKDAASFMKIRISLCRALYRDPRTPRAARWLLWAAMAYALSPVDLIPDFIPVLGHLDDAVLVPLMVFLAFRMVPGDLYREHRERVACGDNESVSANLSEL